jgi:hypothetical protein
MDRSFTRKNLSIVFDDIPAVGTAMPTKGEMAGRPEGAASRRLQQ